MYSRTLLVVGPRWHPVQMRSEEQIRADMRRNLQTVGQRIQGTATKTLEAPDEPTGLIAVDLDQKMWVARSNPKVIKALMLGVSGTATSDGVDMTLWRGAGDKHRAGVGDRTLFQGYFSNGHPRARGRAFLGDHPGIPGGHAFYTVYERRDDPSVMTPIERMAEMLDRACRSPRLKQRFKDQFGGMIDPAILIPFAAIFLATFGAQAIGGAAAALAISRLMGVSQILCDIMIYKPLAERLWFLLNSDKVQAQTVGKTKGCLDEGADIVEEIIVQLITDLATAVSVQSLISVAGKLLSFLVRAAPDSVVQYCMRLKGVAEAYFQNRGYAARERLRSGHDAIIETPADRSFREKSIEHREAIVLRESDWTRFDWVTGKTWHRQKPTWLKAKAKYGWHGTVCVLESEVVKGGKLKPAPTSYDTARLKGVNPEIDAAVDRLGRQRPMYEFPTDGRPIDGIDYGYTGKNNVVVQGHYLVDMGEGRMMIVDRLGNPYVGDIDVVARQRPGMAQAGDHLAGKGDPVRPHVEDDFILEYELNESYRRTGETTPLSDHSQHGGAGASVVHVRVAKAKGHKHWSPREKDGSYAKERLIVYLPEWDPQQRRIVSNRYIFSSWGDYEAFARANNWEFPF